MNIKPFYDLRTHTLTYVVSDPESKDAVVIDPVLDYSPVGATIWTQSVDQVIEYLTKENLTLRMILETHAHADHLSGAQMIKEKFPDAVLAIGERITEVQRVFKQLFDLPDDFAIDGSQFDRLLVDRESVRTGTLSFTVHATPGHTPACSTYQFGDAIFTGDTVFMPDVGTGRCDFPGGSATDLYASVQKLYAMPDDTRVFPGHDYPKDRDVTFWAPLSEHKSSNVALPADRTEKDFVQWRETRDSGLSAPKLLFQSVQVNVDAGKLPEAHANEKRYLKIPLNVFRPPSDPEAPLELSTVGE